MLRRSRDDLRLHELLLPAEKREPLRLEDAHGYKWARRFFWLFLRPRPLAHDRRLPAAKELLEPLRFVVGETAH
ncbi:hypothetical protein [Mumia zhuanghuii]|uniref:Uncharacterized protein n=1 Tax=Mumia zhuanghuii TaxID=2585211 RepID=A0A5C4MEJ9_9ACTN|nr:hypothetical protein [Mumia zhuanghuii]TNC33513.1 hypothetical protein FHE65_28910 [Mumia zhuanghuii]